MKHYIITNRAIEIENGKEFIKTDGKEMATDSLRFAIYDTNANPNQIHSRYQLLPDLPLSSFVAESSDGIPDFKNPYHRNYEGMTHSDITNLKGSEYIFADLFLKLKSANQTKSDILLFIHGYNNDLKTALDTLQELHGNYVENEESPIQYIVLFTWPARSNLLRYRDDARDAELSGYALGRAYQMLIDFFRQVFGKNPENPKSEPCGNKIHLMAHSMGNIVLEGMILKLIGGCNHRSVTTIFKQIILVGADIDWSCLEDPKPMYKIGEITERVTVYNNRNDAALFISETSKNAFNRLGKYGPRDISKTPSHVYFIDVTDAKGNPPGREQIIHHWYYQYNPTVISDICYVLNGVPSGEIQGRYLTSDGRRYRLR